MALRKAIGIIVICTQAVVVVDYNMQSQKAGLKPGALSMQDYFAIVQKRYEEHDGSRLAAAETGTGGAGLWHKVADLSAGSGDKLTDTVGSAEDTAAAEAPNSIYIRRGTTTNCQ